MYKNTKHLMALHIKLKIKTKHNSSHSQFFREFIFPIRLTLLSKGPLLLLFCAATFQIKCRYSVPKKWIKKLERI